jgi:8-oxo-dGTP diphosphatase
MLTGVERLISSPYVRCRQTLEPLAQRLGLPIRDEARLIEGTPFMEALALITAPGPSAAMSTHGDIVEDLVAHVVRRGLVPPAETGGSKASTWELEVANGKITVARYIRPPR